MLRALLRTANHNLSRPFVRPPSLRLFTTPSLPPRDVLGPYDALIVGAGPAGLAAAIRLKQAAPDAEVCVVEKAAAVGAHTLSGAVVDPRGMDALFPGEEGRREWVEAVGAQKVGEDKFWYLTERRKIPLPTPPDMDNEGNYIVSLSRVVSYLGEKAEALGVEIYPGFAGAELLTSGDSDDGVVLGVATGDMGVAKSGAHKASFQRGVEIRARATLLAEGARGSLTKECMKRFGLREAAGAQEMTYALGVKEVWDVAEGNHRPGEAIHSIGWPLPRDTYGGSFVYHMKEKNRVSLGFVVGLDYNNPYLSPFQEFQRFKTHPAIRGLLAGGKMVQYGARTLNEGGLQCVPKLTFPGGALIGCAGGLLNVAQIKGTHTAMMSGVLAADAIAAALAADPTPAAEEEEEAPEDAVPKLISLDGYERALKESWVWSELHATRNIRPSFKFGFLPFLAYSGLEAYLLRGRVPWTLKHAHAGDHTATGRAAKHKPIAYPKPDGELTFDVLSCVAMSGTNHDHDSPSHLVLKDAGVPKAVNVPKFAAPESRYCPAKVYEYVDGELVINAQNCVHCKACDIKDPTQNIVWTVPEGGGGPKYTAM